MFIVVTVRCALPLLLLFRGSYSRSNEDDLEKKSFIVRWSFSKELGKNRILWGRDWLVKKFWLVGQHQMEEVFFLLLSPFLYIDGNYQMMRTEEITFVGNST